METVQKKHFWMILIKSSYDRGISYMNRDRTAVLSFPLPIPFKI